MTKTSKKEIQKTQNIGDKHIIRKMLLYETQNAFDILMNDALQTTKQIMEQIN